jgi:hypothetical protein
MPAGKPSSRTRRGIPVTQDHPLQTGGFAALDGFCEKLLCRQLIFQNQSMTGFVIYGFTPPKLGAALCALS